MDINITLTIHSPVLDKLLQLVESDKAAAARTPTAARTNNVTAAAPPPAPAEVAKKRGPKKAAEPKPAPEEETEPAAVQTPSPRSADLMKAAAAMQPLVELTEADVVKMVSETMDVTGVPAVRDVLKRFKAASVKTLPPEKYADFAAALQEMRDMVGTSETPES